MHRVLTVAVTAATLVLSAAACSDASAGAPVTITWWDTSEADKEAPAFKALVEEFEHASPRIKVTYVNVPFVEAQTRYEEAELRP
ncbi:hypothetical protein [Streptomyces sp. H27-S2]|uniref:hypothetical protein n=1 Tax=Streptomyces antarcticus TaxID=2996458 RepID=UPI003B635E6C